MQKYNEEEFDLSKEDVDSIISLCEEYIFEADLFIKVNQISSELRDIASGIQTLNDSILNRIKRNNEKILETLTLICKKRKF